jgi:hypothetical protein
LLHKEQAAVEVDPVQLEEMVEQENLLHTQEELLTMLGVVLEEQENLIL